MLDIKDSLLNFSYDPEYGIASITDKKTGIKINCILTIQNQSRSAQLAYIGARLSRDNKPLEQIVDSIYQKNIDANKKMEAIFHGYGHASVGDMASGIFVFFENIPMINMMKLFYQIPVLAGQENSSRYITFDDWNYVEPKVLNLNSKLQEEYVNILNSWMDLYKKSIDIYTNRLNIMFQPETKKEKTGLAKRALDCARHFLPIGCTTNGLINTNARLWSRVISELRGSNEYINRRIGLILLKLLAGCEELNELGYIPEAPTLIRHSDPKYHIRDTFIQVREFLLMQNPNFDEFEYVGSEYKNSSKLYKTINKNLLDRYLSLLLDYSFETWPLKDISLSLIESIINNNCNHHNEINNIADFSQYTICSKLDIGSLKDFNRHRSISRFSPLLEDYYFLDIKYDFIQALYYKDFELQDQAISLLKRIKELHYNILNYLDIRKEELQNLTVIEWIKHLLPHGYETYTEMGFNFKTMNYFYKLRSRPGGHINYRLLSESYKNLLFPSIKGPSVEVTNREQFFDRN